MTSKWFLELELWSNYYTWVMWIFVRTYHNFLYEPWKFSKLDIGFNEVPRVSNWVCIYGFGNVNVLMVWEMFWVELNRRKQVFELKCCFKWLRVISYVLAIEPEVFEFKMMCYFSVLIHIFSGTCFTWSKLGFYKWYETWNCSDFGFRNLSENELLWTKMIAWLVYSSYGLRRSMWSWYKVLIM